MNRALIFLGEPGSDAPQMLVALKSAGFSARRSGSAAVFSELADGEQAAAIVISPDVEDRAQLIGSIRERPGFADVPVLARVSAVDPTEIEAAFQDGVDDYHVDGAEEQFNAVLAALKREDAWNAVRAPAGKVILAHVDRLERVRIGRVLRRNGFDTHFVAELAELAAAIDAIPARAVVADSGLPGGSVVSLVKKLGQVGGRLPWILIAPHDACAAISAGLGDLSRIQLLDAGSDPESVTFLVNELLAPAPPNARRTPRILYGTPVTFTPLDSGAVSFNGYTYNINQGGLFVRTLTPLPMQTRVDLAFRPPFGRGQVVFTAQVVWRKEFGDVKGAVAPPGMGVQFVEAAPADEQGFEAGYRELLGRIEQVRPSSNGPAQG